VAGTPRLPRCRGEPPPPPPPPSPRMLITVARTRAATVTVSTATTLTAVTIIFLAVTVTTAHRIDSIMTPQAEVGAWITTGTWTTAMPPGRHSWKQAAPTTSAEEEAVGEEMILVALRRPCATAASRASASLPTPRPTWTECSTSVRSPRSWEGSATSSR
jgi:hypothetical protein